MRASNHLFIAVFCVILFMGGYQVDAQINHGLISNTKAILKKADKEFERNAFPSAVTLYKSVLEKDAENNDVKLKIAECYRFMNDLEKADFWYKQFMDNSAFIEKINPVYRFYYGVVLESLGQYNEARAWFSSYQSLVPTDSRVIRKLNSLNNLARFYKDSSLYEIYHLKINTRFSDYSPQVYDDGILFISDRRPESNLEEVIYNPDSIYFRELFKASLSADGSMTEPAFFNSKFEKNYHKGSTLVYDGGQRIVYTRNNKSGILLNHYGIFFAQKAVDRNEWIKVRPFDYNSNKYSCAHPAISSDGQTLFFTSNKQDGKGGTDIWMSKMTEKNNWSEPENLGDKVNTIGSEAFPFLFQDSILFFTSDGHGGLGGTDIYRYNLNTKEEPVNMGYPINSNKNDFALTFDDRGYIGYFSSNREGSLGSDDIYRFTKNIFIEGQVAEVTSGDPIEGVHVLLRNTKENALKGAVTDKEGKYKIQLDIDADYKMFAVKKGFKISEEQDVSTLGMFSSLANVPIKIYGEDLFAKGVITSKSTGEPLENVKVVLKDNANGQATVVNTGLDGSYAFRLKPESWYTLQAEAANYLTEKVELDAFAKQYGTFQNSFALQDAKVDEWAVLEKLVYSGNKSDISPKDEAPLDELAMFLNANPQFDIELRVHTDTKNTDKYNMDLSKTRARAVLYHLVKKGVIENRITCIGFGSTEPLVKCESCTEDENGQNRRVEFMLRANLQYVDSPLKTGGN